MNFKMMLVMFSLYSIWSFESSLGYRVGTPSCKLFGLLNLVWDTGSGAPSPKRICSPESGLGYSLGPKRDNRRTLVGC